MRYVAYVLAALVGGLGIVFIVGYQGELARLVVGGVLFAAAIALVIVARMRPKVIEHRITQKVDLSPGAKLDRMKCESCGAELDQSSLTVVHGVPTVSCPYCQASYQLVEETKW